MHFSCDIQVPLPPEFPGVAQINQAGQRLLEQICILDNLENDFYWSLLLVDDLGIKNINKKYRAIDEVTDVLSFPLLPFSNAAGTALLNPPDNPKASVRKLIDWEANDMLEPVHSEMIELGDVVLSLPQCQRQARQIGHSVELEFWRLCCHGLLHLFGYDHIENEQDRIRMEAKEDQLFLSVTQA